MLKIDGIKIDGISGIECVEFVPNQDGVMPLLVVTVKQGSFAQRFLNNQHLISHNYPHPEGRYKFVFAMTRNDMDR